MANISMKCYQGGLLPPANARPARVPLSICGEIHSGVRQFCGGTAMNLTASPPPASILGRGEADIDSQFLTIWRAVLLDYHGPISSGNLTWRTRCTRRSLQIASCLRRQARQRLRRLLRAHHGAAGHSRLREARELSR